MIKEISCPTEYESNTKEISPIEKFYKAIEAYLVPPNAEYRLNVTAISINPIDSKKLKEEFYNWAEKHFKHRIKKKKQEDIAFSWSNFSPVESDEVSVGICRVDTKRVFQIK